MANKLRVAKQRIYGLAGYARLGPKSCTTTPETCCGAPSNCVIPGSLLQVERRTLYLDARIARLGEERCVTIRTCCSQIISGGPSDVVGVCALRITKRTIYLKQVSVGDEFCVQRPKNCCLPDNVNSPCDCLAAPVSAPPAYTVTFGEANVVEDGRCNCNFPTFGGGGTWNFVAPELTNPLACSWFYNHNLTALNPVIAECEAVTGWPSTPAEVSAGIEPTYDDDGVINGIILYVYANVLNDFELVATYHSEEWNCYGSTRLNLIWASDHCYFPDYATIEP